MLGIQFHILKLGKFFISNGQLISIVFLNKYTCIAYYVVLLDMVNSY